MIRFKLCKYLVLGTMLFVSGNAIAKKIEVFGYSQIALTGVKDLENSDTRVTSNFTVQEADIFLQGNLSPSITTLFDLQVTGNLNTVKSWGNIALDEAWIKFSPYKSLNIKVGKVRPIFNNFNEIKTRFPLFPYITRPIAYETSYQEALALDQWVPEHVMLQVNGITNLGSLKYDYALYGGNSEFIQNKVKKQSLVLPGDDTTNYKLVGARMGVRSQRIKCGISGTYDYTRSDVINGKVNDQNVFNSTLPFKIPTLPNLGPIPRARFGVDLSFSGGGFTFESEYVLVKEYPDDNQEKNLKLISDGTIIPAGAMGPAPVKQIGTDLTKTFWYVNIMYDFLEKAYASVGFSENLDASDLLIEKNGVCGIHFCLGYRITDNVTFKTELTNIRNDLFSDDIPVTLNQIIPQMAVSVFF